MTFTRLLLLSLIAALAGGCSVDFSCPEEDGDCSNEDDGGPGGECFADLDGDGHGDPMEPLPCSAAGASPKPVRSKDDCDDTDRFVFTGAPEACDQKDNDCDGMRDEEVVDSTYYLDADGDGHGAATGSVVACKPPTDQHVLLGDDCDDGCGTCAPGNAETRCDGKDDDCNGSVDEDIPGCGECTEPSIEVCDGLDNDCDDKLDEGFDQSTYFADADRDGHGAGAAVMACMMPPLHVTSGDDCLDDNPAAYPMAPVVLCNDVDEDCDGESDERAAEVCNFVDDDCDGLVDPNMIGLVPDAYEVFTQHTNGLRSSLENVALLPREEGDAWLLYQSAGGGDVPVLMQRLDHGGVAQGARLSSSFTGFRFVADAAGERAAVVYAEKPGTLTNDSVALRAHFYTSADMGKTGELSIGSFQDDDNQRGDKNDANDCHDLVPLDASVMQDSSGVWRVALVYRESIGQAGQSSCTSVSTVFAQVATLGADQQWTLSARTEVPSLGVVDASIERVPCRDEWIVGTKSASGATARRLSTEAVLGQTNLDTFDVKDGISALAASPTDCSSPLVYMHVGIARSELTSVGQYLRRWQIDRLTGTVSRPEGDTEVAVTFDALGMGLAAGHGRAVSVSALDPQGDIEIWEVVAVRALSELRKVATMLNDGDPTRPLPDPGSSITQIRTLVLRDTVVFAVGRGSEGGNMEQYRKPGDMDTPAVVTYRLDCP